MDRCVIHLNIADFGTAVEQLEDSSLRLRPLILAPPATRAVVYDMSESAYREGIRKGMPINLARRICRQAHFRPPRPERYARALDTVFRTALQYTPLVERSCGDGHLFLDVTGTHRLFGPAPDIGWRIRKAVRAELGFNPIWSVAPNKLLAKVASRLVKPIGEYIVASGEEQHFLAPLPLSLLPGIHHADLLRLQEFNLRQVAQAARLPLEHLAVLCGSNARSIHQAVRGIDHSAVRPPSTDRGVLEIQHHFDSDTNQDHDIRAAMAAMAGQAGNLLRSRKQGCCRVAVHLQYSDGGRCARQSVSKTPVDDDATLNRLAENALYSAWRRRVRLRAISLSCSRIVRIARQLSLFGDLNSFQRKQTDLCRAIDSIHAKFGKNTVRKGRQLTNTPDQVPIHRAS